MGTFGKHSFQSVYQQPLPAEYFRSLAPLRYRCPDFTDDLLPTTIAEVRRRAGRKHLRVVDLACGYGINSALLKCDLRFWDLAQHYGGAAHEALNPPEMIARDSAFVRTALADADLTVIGVDVARAATDYALATGLIDAAVNTNLERDDPTACEASALAEADLVLATGAFSYVGAATLNRVLALQDPAPVVLGWPIYGQPTAELEACLTDHHLTVTRPEPAPRHQRHFADSRERSAYHAALRRNGLPYRGTAAETSLCVTPILARPTPA
ncbi:hypothetical protein [Kitasatospora sp. GP82]|uniref:hypothetical protein n=1 Tax=Kitasatospora sp. GP82 TaxID=3035089 RepID=UPI0024754BD4|nr:hypothetical protein [Kitasatospora sp. GP82]MDH6129247.1 SAM-dependent methyltransferase [Kitasatospora sp. GP82]